MADGHRHFILAARPGKNRMRDVLMTDPDGDTTVLAVVPDESAFDVVEALRTAYAHGQQDLLDRLGTRCGWCRVEIEQGSPDGPWLDANDPDSEGALWCPQSPGSRHEPPEQETGQ
jgi:hypothetical protein